MKAKEKAIELYNKLRKENAVMTANIRAKYQALIAVDEIIQELIDYKFNNDVGDDIRIDYWQGVKKEIEKL